ncbi:MAG: DUF4292 domain-containing protein [Flavobacteriaceae bacterium]|nr:DUF4292 domain-containing protein [Flavobacteriaceae bacterium]
MKYIKILLTLLVLASVVSCGSIKGTSSVEGKSSYKKSLKLYKKNKVAYDNLSFKSKVGVKVSGGSSVRLSSTLKMKKDELVLFSARVFGMSVLKAKVDRDSVFMYNKHDKNYIMKPISLINDLFNVEFSVSDIQKIFEAKAVGSLTKRNLKHLETTDKGYLVKDKKIGIIYELAANGTLLSQSFSHKKNKVVLEYAKYDDHDGFMYPKQIVFKYFKSGKINFSLTIYIRSVVWNKEKETYKFKIPKGYKELNII